MYNYNSDKYVDSSLAVGDKVLIPKMGSVSITVEGEDYYIVKEQDVYSKIVPENPIAEVFKQTEAELKKGDITGDHYFVADINEQKEL